ncbi:polymorphic toxin-type HINT domain-containing protein [Streptomyces katrae]|uniref:polymorphic toxin-type HINT domain-containing protein n=1 Tax=Streptomyces katrae TaxID=68223 RepID=UPI001F285AD3|nr:polymorphic toxin-type HINT domain-containing protein [Streptomyces katrae]
MADSKDRPPLPSLKQPKAVPVDRVRAGGEKKKDDADTGPWKAPKVVWPAAGTAEVDLASGPVSKSFLSGSARTPAIGSGPQKAGKLPVALDVLPGKASEAPAKVNVTVTSHDAARKAGVDGVLLSVGRSDNATRAASAKVEVDYNSFRGAYGGDYAARLRLVELPACALTTPDRAECRTQKPLATENDTRGGTLTAQVTTPGVTGQPEKSGQTPKSAPAAAPAAGAPAMVLAATAGASGPTGDYKATSLQPSGSWNAGGSTGGFSWSYDIGTPSVPGGFAPKISLGYSSQAVDGRMAASNNQASWIGDGWSWEPGFIERRYKSCEDDKTGGTNTTKVGDQCWFNDNATLSLNGKSTELVFEQGKGWHPAADTGEKVEKLTGAVNGDKGTAGVDGVGEHWKITATDGTQYFFGLNRLPGWKDNGTAADDPTTNSTWTVPVYGNQTGEPCYNASFASGWCQQAWRWQLDYVVAPTGNAMAYYWKTETNNYARNVSSTTGKGTVTPYIRGGWLDHIDYGLRSDSVYTAKAMGQVIFDVSERCLSTCGTFDETNAKNWPDAPYDLFCKDGSTECKDQFSPTFWSRKRLTGINTKVLTGGVYKDADSWTLDHSFPPAGDGISTPLWLKSITRTAKAGDAADVPMLPVTFAGEQRPNRVDALGDGLAPFVRLRMYQVTTETGGTIGVTYSQPDCTATTLPKPDATNTTRCYPVKWAWEGETSKVDWFNSYVVTQIVEGDNLASTPDKVTSYSYLGGAAWEKSTDELTKADDRVHSLARGYGLVQTRTGAASDPKTLSETRYFRGIDGKDVNDSAGVAVTDRPEFAGMPRETATYDGDDTGKLISATSSTPWRSGVVAKRTRSGLPDLVSYKTGTERQSTRTTVTGGTRTTETVRHYDDYGMVDWESQLGDTAKTGDEQCTTTSYARNTASWILGKVSRVETVAVPCGTAASRPADVIADSRTYYDNGAIDTVPGPGLVTKAEKINAKGDGYDPESSVPSTCGPANNQLCYDIYGRQLVAADPYGKVTTTAYTPAVGEVPTATLVTNPKGHTASSELDPVRSQPTKTTDANGKVTTTAYDALGRVTKVWLPNRPAATFPDAPSRVFDYTIRNDGPSVITSKSLTHDYKYSVSYSIQDGLLRERQTQTQSPDLSGRLISETFYDTRGLAWRSSGTYYADGAPEPQLVTGQETNYPASTDTVYDGAGRTTAVISKKYGQETKRATTLYTGDTTTVIPPQGGTATATVVDGIGRTVETKQYTDAARTASQSTLYTYNKLGQLAQVTDPANAKWTYTYDVRGQQVESNDPDKGITKTAYDAGGRITDVTDARGVTLHSEYDELGRPAALKQGATTLSANVYDTVAKGQLTKSVRYVDGNAFESEVTAYNDLYQPLTSKTTIPATPDTGALAGTYNWTNTYNIAGQVLTTKQPAMGDLPAETVGSTYKSVSGLLNSMGAGSSRLVSAMTYDHYGRTSRQELGAIGQRIYRSTEYDEHTGATTRSYTDRDVAPQRIEDTRYTTDPAGNLTSIATAYGQDTARTTDTQCVNLDALRRITEAWTNKGETCAATPSTTVIGGEDPYWTTYTYDAVGNRKTETKHKTASGPTADTVRTYAAPTAGKHDLPKVTQTGTGAHDEVFTYDASGNTKTRKSGTDETQYLAWDAEGHLKSLDQGPASSSFTYDVSGQRLMRKDSTGTTLYLPNGNELRLDKAGALKGTRYYGDIAMRTGGKLVFTLADHHGTGTTQVSADAAQTVTRRKTGLFGEARGAKPTGWSGERGFVGGTKDADSGLTHIGAREYDPLIGRFISVDPIMDLKDSQQLHGYTYANQNPVTFWDPTGKQLEECASGMYKCHNGNDPYAYGNRYETIVESVGGTVSDDYVRYKHYGCADFTCKKGSSWGTGSSGGSHTSKPTSPKPPKKPDFSWSNPVSEAFYGIFANAAHASSMFGWIADGDCWNGGAGAPGCDYGGDYEEWLQEQGIDTSSDWYQVPGFLGSMFSHREPGAGLGGRGRATGQCFLAGTLVRMADGSEKKIEDIQVGDEVLATDPRSGETGAQKVTDLIRTEGLKELNSLSVASSSGVDELVATREHPFWSPSEKAWVIAGDLKPGATLLTDAGELVHVVGNRAYTQYVKTYNFTVANLHTYHVKVGSAWILVHNTCTPSGGGDIFSHFTDARGARGIAGVDAEGMAVGQTIAVRSVQFGQGANEFMATGAGDMFVTTLGRDASQGQLGRVGVFGDRQNYVVQFSQEAAFVHDVRPVMNPGNSSIFTMPGGSQFSGDFTYTVTRVR